MMQHHKKRELQAEGDEVRKNLGLGAIWSQNEHPKTLSSFGMARHLAMQAWRNILISPSTSLVSLITIAVSLFLLGAFILLVETFHGVLRTTQTDFTLRLYLRDSVNEQQTKEIASNLRKENEVEGVEFHTREEALKEFRESLGPQASVLDGLEDENPLPAFLEVKFLEQSSTPQVFKRISEQYSNNALIEHVEYNRGILDQIGNFIALFRTIGIVATLLMLVLTAFIIANTIKLALYAHREEIEIMRLVGATSRFVRAPYMIEGCVQGVLGSALSILLLYGLYLILDSLSAGSQLLALFLPKLHFLSFPSLCLMIVSGVLVGLGATYISTRKFLDGYS